MGGTDPSEGAALAVAILDYLRQRGCLTVATTHYKELKSYALNNQDVENASCEFDTVTMRPTYRLFIGVPGVSNAFVISRRLGLDPAIIADAEALISDEGVRFESFVASIEKSHREAKRLEAELKTLEQETLATREQLEREREKLAKDRASIVQKAREEAREIYEEAVAEADYMLQLIRAERDERTNRVGIAEEARSQLRSQLRAIEGKIGKETLRQIGAGKVCLDEIEPGQRYAAPSLGIVGQVVEKPDRKGNVLLEQGTLRVSVPVEALVSVSDETDRRETKGGARIGQRKGRKVPSVVGEKRLYARPELMLIGQTVVEALDTLDQFLDDAVLASLETVRITHGKGTGALRQAVADFLKKDSRVKSFRLGTYGEGDSGVTIATLK